MKNVASIAIAIFVFASCRTNSSSRIKEEGLFVADKTSLSRIVARMAAEYKWDQKTADSAIKTLRKVTAATFRLECNGSSGTGVFTGPHGEFVTVAHVLDETRACHIETIRLTAGDIVETVQSMQILVVEKSKDTPSRFDITTGHFLNFASPRYLELNSSDIFKSNSSILALGFSGATARNGSKIETNKSPRSEIDSKPAQDELFNAYCGDEQQKSRAETVKLLKPSYPELAEANELSIKACDVAKAEYSQRHSISYDQIPDTMPLTIGFGKLVSFDENKGITTADAYHGMSGGPNVDLETGALIGLCDRGISVNEKDPIFKKFPIHQDGSAIFYTGVKIIEMTGKSRLSQLPVVTSKFPTSWTPADFISCSKTISSSASTANAIAQIEEKNGTVDFVVFGNDKTYLGKMPSASAGQNQQYLLNQARKSV
jgi:hypothetical protein